ncbi:MAG: ATP-binding cassette domain-containing protein, partial [Clostridiales bacterium]|nr:ATP-binding cassette domain-containing protein [Clostridiales bacterium]
MKIEKLSMNFNGIIAIEDFSFEVEKGSITSLIGPNGAGKTSLFNCLTGFYKASSGDILFDGESLINVKPYKITQRGIIRTFQNVRLFKNMTTLENVMSGAHSITKQSVFGALFRHPSERREEDEILRSAEYFLDYIGILDKKNTLAKNLSYGD